MSNSTADLFADYLQSQEEKTVEAFMYLREVPKDHVLNTKDDRAWFDLPLKNRLDGSRLLRMSRGED